MTATVPIRGRLFDGAREALQGQSEILIEDGIITEMAGSVSRADGAQVIDLSDRTVSPGFVDTHVHLCVPTCRR